MSIRDWPDGERPREKLLARGGAALSDAELLAVFLGSGRRGRNAVELGRALLARRRRPQAAARHAARRAASAPVAWCRLVAALELGRRYLDAEMKAATDAGRSVGERALSQVAALRLSVRGVRVPVPRQPPPRDRVRGAVPRLDRRRQRASARGRAALPRAQRGRGDPRAQPSVRRQPSRARPTARSRCACATRWRSSTCACSTTSSSATASRSRSPSAAGFERRLPMPRRALGILRRARGAWRRTGDLRLSARISTGRDRAAAADRRTPRALRWPGTMTRSKRCSPRGAAISRRSPRAPTTTALLDRTDDAVRLAYARLAMRHGRLGTDFHAYHNEGHILEICAGRIPRVFALPGARELSLARLAARCCCSAPATTCASAKRRCSRPASARTSARAPRKCCASSTSCGFDRERDSRPLRRARAHDRRQHVRRARAGRQRVQRGRARAERRRARARSST